MQIEKYEFYVQSLLWDISTLPRYYTTFPRTEVSVPDLGREKFRYNYIIRFLLSPRRGFFKSGHELSLDLAGFLNHWVPWGTHNSLKKKKKKKFCSKCFDPYIKSCALAMRSSSTVYGSKTMNSRRAMCSWILLPSWTAEYHGVLTLILYWKTLLVPVLQ
jgi:hypothetical protein